MIWVEIGPNKFIQLDLVRKVWIIEGEQGQINERKPNAQIEYLNGDKASVIGEDAVENLKYAMKIK